MSDSDVSDVTFVPRYLEGQSAVTIQHVSCGDFFTACITGLSVCLFTLALSLSRSSWHTKPAGKCLRPDAQTHVQTDGQPANIVHLTDHRMHGERMKILAVMAYS